MRLAIILASCIIALRPVATPGAELRTLQAKPGSPAEVVQWQKNLREKFHQLLKIEDLVASEVKIPFDPAQNNRWDMGAYVAKKLTIRSTPGRVITIFITLPKSDDKKHPAVVCIGGHG